MNVKLPDDWVSAYYDGELSPAEREEADRRLQTSAEARTELEELRRLSVALRSLPAALAPAELRHAVLQQAERSMLISSPEVNDISPHRGFQKPRRATRRWQSVSVAIAAGVIVTTSLVLWNGNPRQNNEKSPIVRNETDTTVDGTRVAMKHAETAAVDTSSMASISNFVNGVPGTLTGVPLEGMSLRGDASLTRALEDHMLQNSELIGTIFKYFPSDDEQVAVVEMTVIDVRKSAGMLQVLLSQHEVMAQETSAVSLYDSPEAQLDAAEKLKKDAKESAADTEDLTAKKFNNDEAASGKSAEAEEVATDELVAVFVQATPEQLASTVRELGLENGIVDVSLHPPLQANAEQLASSDEAIWEQLDESLSRQPDFDSQSEIAAAELGAADDLSEGEIETPNATDRKRSQKENRAGQPSKSGKLLSKRDRATMAGKASAATEPADTEGSTVPEEKKSVAIMRAKSEAEKQKAHDADGDGDVAIALKPGQTQEMFHQSAEPISESAGGLRDKNTYQMMLAEPAARRARQRSADLQQGDKLRQMASIKQRANPRSSKTEVEESNAAAEGENAKLDKFIKSDEAKNKGLTTDADAQENSDGLSAGAPQQSVKVLFVFTRPRNFSETPAAPPSSLPPASEK